MSETGLGRTPENGPDGHAPRLHPAEVDAIARRLLELLREEGAITPSARELVTAAEIARRFGLQREWVYEHADRLGAVRLGDGPRPRLRFDPEHVVEALRASTPAPPSRSPEPPRPRRRSAPIAMDLLPIRGGGGRVGDVKKVAGARVNAPGRGTGAVDSDAASTLPAMGGEALSADPSSGASTDRRTDG